MEKKFLLKSETAVKLYEKVKTLPIIDYHNHLSVDDIKNNTRFSDVYHLWVKTDPYKHRAMRMCGVPEKYITGDAPEKEKFVAWCETLPNLIGNPLYHWTKMELELLGVDIFPNGDNAEKIYDLCNEYLKNNVVTAKSLLQRFNVEFACPCASLTDDLFEGDGSIAPSLRGDDIVNPDIKTIKSLEMAAGVKISSLDDYKKAISIRLEEFEKANCKFADHALDNGFKFYADDGKNNERFDALMRGKSEEIEAQKLSSYLLLCLGEEYAKRNMAMQLHIGAQRNTSTRLREIAGPAGGYAAIGNSVNVKSLTKLLDTIEQKGGLPKIILFTLNPADNALISVLSGSYSKDRVNGLVTQGSAWWWCDHKSGIENMLENAASFSAISNFVGMTTDSRSFMSFVRHDYFRRILCSFFADKFDGGEVFCEFEELVEVLEKMCYKNAKAIAGGNKNV